MQDALPDILKSHLIFQVSRAFFKISHSLSFLFAFREKLYTIFIQTPGFFVGNFYPSLQLFIVIQKDHFFFEFVPSYN